MTTLQDVAKRAGVSTATVSKVLSNTPYVSEETRERVMEALRELNYTPNLAARALATGKTKVIAVVFPYVYDAIFTDPLVMQIIEGIEAECSQRGYNLLLSTPRLSAHSPDENYRVLIQSGYMDGLIAIDNVPEASVIRPAIERNIPSVAIGYHPTDYYVRTDDRSGGSQLMEHLLANGHRRMGIITVPENMNFAVNERMIGLQTVATAHGLDFAALPLAYGNYSLQSGAECAASLLTEHPDLTALICLNDRMAMGAIQQLQQMGYNVPADVAVVGYDNISTGEISKPALTTIDQHATQLGQTAAQMLFEVLNGAKPSPVMLPTHLIVRDSSR